MARPVKIPPQPSPRRYDSPLRRAKAQETERRVLDAAASLFAERGYVGTSLAAVAEQAGVNARTIYKVFDSKLALLSRLVDVATQAQLGRSQALFNGAFNLGVTSSAFAFGVVADRYGYRPMFVLASVTPLVACVLFYAGTGRVANRT